MPASAIALAMAVFAGPAIAQKAERPEVNAGDQWQFAVYYSVPVAKPNRVWVIESVTPVGITATENGEPLTLTPELNVLESPSQKESNSRALSFPLEVGKRWRYASDWVFKPKSSTGRSDVEVVVTGREKIAVPAGEFDAFKLVAKGKLSGTSPINSQYDAQTTTTYWYSPAARAIVKSIHHNPYLGTSTVELVGYRLRP
jgi:hypothetical protein